MKIQTPKHKTKTFLLASFVLLAWKKFPALISWTNWTLKWENTLTNSILSLSCALTSLVLSKQIMFTSTKSLPASTNLKMGNFATKKWDLSLILFNSINKSVISPTFLIPTSFILRSSRKTFRMSPRRWGKRKWENLINFWKKISSFLMKLEEKYNPSKKEMQEPWLILVLYSIFTKQWKNNFEKKKINKKINFF